MLRFCRTDVIFTSRIPSVRQIPQDSQDKIHINDLYISITFWQGFHNPDARSYDSRANQGDKAQSEISGMESAVGIDLSAFILTSERGWRRVKLFQLQSNRQHDRLLSLNPRSKVRSGDQVQPLQRQSGRLRCKLHVSFAINY